MSPHRTKEEIIKDILYTISLNNDEILSTHLLRKANLSHLLLWNYLSDLIKQQYVQKMHKGSHQYFSLTGKGHAFMLQLRNTALNGGKPNH